MGERTNDVTSEYGHAGVLLDILQDILHSSQGISKADLRKKYFSHLKKNGPRKSLNRSLAELESFGFVFYKQSTSDGSPILSIDEKTWANPEVLGNVNTVPLDFRCMALLEDPTFELPKELGSALAKMRTPNVLRIDLPTTERGFSANSNAGILLSACVLDRTCAVTYKIASGETRHYDLDPLASFTLRDSTYFVCSKHGTEEDPHVYREDRFIEVRPTSSTFDRPEGFDVEDYILLPFQIGEQAGTAIFRPSSKPRDDMHVLFGSKGTYLSDGSVEVGYSNASEAASWAVSNGLIPLGDEDVVSEWTLIVKGRVS